MSVGAVFAVTMLARQGTGGRRDQLLPMNSLTAHSIIPRDGAAPTLPDGRSTTREKGYVPRKITNERMKTLHDLLFDEPIS